MDVQNNATLHLQQIKAINTDTVHKICSGQVNIIQLLVDVWWKLHFCSSTRLSFE